MASPPAFNGEFSRGEFRSGKVYPIIDPMKVAACFAGFVCALVLVGLIWTNRSNSLGYWRVRDSAIWGLVCYAPIATLLWSLIAFPRIGKPSYVWLRRSIRLHAIVAAGIIVAGCSGLAGNSYFFNPIFGIIAFGALLIDLAVLGFAPGSAWDSEDIEIYRVAQLKVAGGAVTALVVWSFANIGLVIAQSELIAWGKPYCLQVAGDYLGRYKPVGSLMDLNGLKMHTPFASGGGSGEFQFAYHGVLVVDRGDTLEWRHWSYSAQHFVRHNNGRGIAAAGRPSCEPRSHFASQLSIW